MNNMKKSLKASNGITLIALVITIIVLLILAGISISMLSGDNSILQKATDAKTRTDEAQLQEQKQLDKLSGIIEEKTIGNGVFGKLYNVNGKKVLVLDNNPNFEYSEGTLEKEYSDCGNSVRSWTSEAGQINKVVINGYIFPKTTQAWFANCVNLTEIENIQKINTSNVTNMQAMFFQTKLTSLDLRSFDTSNVTNMHMMFSQCRQLTNIDLSSFDTSKVNSMTEIFSNCVELTNLDLESFDTSSASNMQAMFANCSKLEEILVGNKWDYTGTGNDVRGGSMFGGCGTNHVTVIQ